MQNDNQLGDQSIAALPPTLSIRDLVVIVSVAITLAVQWGLFSTRVTLLEQNVVRLEQTVKDQSDDIRKLQFYVQQNTQNVDELYRLQNKPTPQHTAPF